MESKKNPMADLHRYRGVIYNFSLAISLLVVIAAFEWTQPVAKVTRKPPADYVEADPLPFVPPFREKKAEPNPTQKPVTTSTRYVAVANERVIAQPSEDDAEQPAADIPTASFGFGEMPPEIPDFAETFRVVEKMPEPAGGWEGFFKTLQKHLKYPKPAVRAGAIGKVFIEFTVNEKGEPVDLHIIKGIGYGCDEEALRVLALTRWQPGKQRGRPVKVRLVQPITFSLQ